MLTRMKKPYDLTRKHLELVAVFTMYEM